MKSLAKQLAAMQKEGVETARAAEALAVLVATEGEQDAIGDAVFIESVKVRCPGLQPRPPASQRFS